ncbi:MAG: rRNA maturation RNase YbeY [Deltaproteobacteria bacterium]|uniref:Endoribonuclease YbeY n=1 Tax=Candidatus Zymogenus saltonus TaxID=2844893 RepID=A0A9D8KEF0_9DELT|nr:rRNA maturation RNase YbeY [Candidatus Zymogenus saltonus]
MKVQTLLEETGRDKAELSILLTDDETISSLNERYLNRKGATNVLSFGQGEPQTEGTKDLPPYILGDIVVSVDTAERQAKTRGVGLTEEIIILTVHGLLHLLGYVHDPREGASTEDELLMLKEEARLLSLIGIHDI